MELSSQLRRAAIAIVIGALLGTLLAAAVRPAPTPAATACSIFGDLLPGELSAREARKSIRCLINKRREARDRRTLDKSGDLKDAANYHNNYMQRHGCFSHQCAGEPDLERRVRNTGYQKGASSWGVGENIAWGRNDFATPKALVKAWMDSRTHRRLLLKRKWRDIGVAVDWGTPWNLGALAATSTAVFGFRRG